MHKIEANEIVGTTFYTIDRIGELKNGGDVLLLYFAYIKQSRIQETNQSRSLDNFMIEKMKWGRDRFRNAKNGLKDLGLIDVIQSRSPDGKIDTWYVKVNFIINEQKIRTHNIVYTETTHLENQTTEIPPAGETTTNALSTKLKCLKNLKERKTDFEKTFEDFKTMRNKIKKPLTARAEKIILTTLNKLSSDEKIQIAILEQSVLYCWQTVYPLKNINNDYTDMNNFHKAMVDGKRDKVVQILGKEKYAEMRRLWKDTDLFAKQ